MPARACSSGHWRFLTDGHSANQRKEVYRSISPLFVSSLSGSVRTVAMTDAIVIANSEHPITNKAANVMERALGMAAPQSHKRR